jgi:membrane-associated phospholipid phosphatase
MTDPDTRRSWHARRDANETMGCVPWLPSFLPGTPVDRWTWIRRGAEFLYLAVMAWIVVVFGVPTGRQAIAMMLIIGLMTTRVGRGWPALGRVFVDWLPFTAVLILYDRTRALADAFGLPLHEVDIVHAEKWICGGIIPTVWLQEHLYNPSHIYWYDALVTLIYTSHFVATPLLAAVLWLRERAQWLRYITRVIVLSVPGLVTYVLFPEAPPWLASQDGYIRESVPRLSSRGWEWLRLGDVTKALSRAQIEGSNAVAAMPSMHVAFACLVALFIASRLHSRWRHLLLLYPVAMGFALVYTGEHYVLDLVVGVAYAVAAHLAMNAWERRRSAAGLRTAEGRPISTSDGLEPLRPR